MSEWNVAKRKENATDMNGQRNLKLQAFTGVSGSQISKHRGTGGRMEEWWGKKGA